MSEKINVPEAPLDAYAAGLIHGIELRHGKPLPPVASPLHQKIRYAAAMYVVHRYPDYTPEDLLLIENAMLKGAQIGIEYAKATP